jgi:hypothetical protein
MNGMVAQATAPKQVLIHQLESSVVLFVKQTATNSPGVSSIKVR